MTDLSSDHTSTIARIASLGRMLFLLTPLFCAAGTSYAQTTGWRGELGGDIGAGLIGGSSTPSPSTLSACSSGRILYSQADCLEPIAKTWDVSFLTIRLRPVRHFEAGLEGGFSGNYLKIEDANVSARCVSNCAAVGSAAVSAKYGASSVRIALDAFYVLPVDDEKILIKAGGGWASTRINMVTSPKTVNCSPCDQEQADGISEVIEVNVFPGVGGSKAEKFRAGFKFQVRAMQLHSSGLNPTSSFDVFLPSASFRHNFMSVSGGLVFRWLQ